MTLQMTNAVMTVVLGLGMLGVFYVVTKEADTFTKSVFGYFFTSAWAVSTIMAAVSRDMSDQEIHGWFVVIVVLPALPFGYIVARLCHARRPSKA